MAPALLFIIIFIRRGEWSIVVVGGLAETDFFVRREINHTHADDGNE